MAKKLDNSSALSSMSKLEDRFRLIDFQLSDYLKNTLGVPSSLAQLVAWLHYRAAEGDICVPLSICFEETGIDPGEVLDADFVHCANDLVVSTEERFLTLYSDCIYLSRNWNFWVLINARLATLATQSLQLDKNETDFRQQLKAAFDDESLAFMEGLGHRPLQIISGGPGTGKTTLAASLLAWYASGAVHGDTPQLHQANWRFCCLAPTGKAAAHLSQSIQKNMDDLAKKAPQCASSLSLLRDGIDAKTIHRYIHSFPSVGDRYPSPETKLYRYPQLIIIDEASMIDMALMHELLIRTSDSTVLIMLGDAHQLGPIEVGECYRQWILPAQERFPHIEDALVELNHSYRFQGGIAQLADSVKHQDTVRAEKTLLKYQGELDLRDFENLDLDSLASNYEAYWELAIDQVSVETLAKAFVQYQILCTRLEGPYGCEQVNRSLMQRHSLWLERKQSVSRGYENMPIGTPLMITKNQYDLGIYNGDVGFVYECEHQDDHELVWVLPPITDTQADPAECVQIPLRQLQHYQVAYAITVHKSQGSEFEKVDIILPPRNEFPPQRALLYTAVTRARTHCRIISDRETLEHYVEAP